MADISITAANVGMTTTKPRTQRVMFGESVTEGKLVYKKTSDNKYYLANADAVDAATATIAGVVLNPAGDGEYGDIATGLDYDCGATVVVGEWYALSAANDGGIAPFSDIAATNIVSMFGYGATTSTIHINIVNTGLVHG